MAKSLRTADASVFGDLRVILIGSFIIVFLISLILPEYAAWIVKRTFDVFYVIIHFFGGVLIGVVWIILKFINFIGLHFDADSWRVEVANNLGDLLQIIANITYGLVDGAFNFVAEVNPIDDVVEDFVYIPPPPAESPICYKTGECEF